MIQVIVLLCLLYRRNKTDHFDLLLQVLNRLTYASTLSHLRRLNSPIGREGNLSWLFKHDPAYSFFLSACTLFV